MYPEPFPLRRMAKYNDLDGAAKIIEKGKTAAVFVEPVQGEGGIFPADPTFLRGLRELCDKVCVGGGARPVRQ